MTAANNSHPILIAFTPSSWKMIRQMRNEWSRNYGLFHLSWQRVDAEREYLARLSLSWRD